MKKEIIVSEDLSEEICSVILGKLIEKKVNPEDGASAMLNACASIVRSIGMLRGVESEDELDEFVIGIFQQVIDQIKNK